MRVVVSDKLVSAVVTEVLLFALTIEAILRNVSNVALWTAGGSTFMFRGRLLSLYPLSIHQRYRFL